MDKYDFYNLINEIDNVLKAIYLAIIAIALERYLKFLNKYISNDIAKKLILIVISCIMIFLITQSVMTYLFRFM